VRSKNDDRGAASLMLQPVVMQYFGESGFFNFGYWLEGTQNQKEACQNLTEKLLGFSDKKEGVILDVACGLGGTTRHLLKYYDPSSVVGIDVSRKQLETSRANAPGCSFILMDAAQLGFQDGQFDKLICIQSAFYFDTRVSFLHEAHRVLNLGGRLLLTDILFSRLVEGRGPIMKLIMRLLERGGWFLPRGNHVKTLEAYRDIYLQAGFDEVQVVEATEECWKKSRRHLMRWAWQKSLERKSRIGTFRRLKALIAMALFVTLLSIVIRHYALVSAKKA